MVYCPKCGAKNSDDVNFCFVCGFQLKTVDMVREKMFVYAGFWRRFVAIIIDVVVLSVLEIFVWFIIGSIIEFINPIAKVGMVFGIPYVKFANYVVSTVVDWLYFTLLESSYKQATLGKMALGIIVTDLNGNRISFGRANVRYWSKIISLLTLCIGYIMAGFTKKKQALHDMIANTLVIKK